MNVNESQTTSIQHLNRLVDPVRLTVNHELMNQLALNASKVLQVDPVNAQQEHTQIRI